jgi:hypothetical protein
VGGDTGGSEAAFSSMASDRASGIRRRHSTKVVARLSFGRAAPTRAQLIPFVSCCYGRIVGLAMRGRFDVRGGQIVESRHLYLGLMAQGKRAATRLGRQGGARKSRARLRLSMDESARSKWRRLERQQGNGAVRPLCEQIDICSPRRR